MPPLVTVSAALLSTNTRSKRGRNFLNACPAMTLGAAVRTLHSCHRQKERPTVGPSGHVNARKSSLFQFQVREDPGEASTSVDVQSRASTPAPRLHVGISLEA